MARILYYNYFKYFNMLMKITAISLAAIAYVNAQAFANIEDRNFLNNFEIYKVDKKL